MAKATRFQLLVCDGPDCGVCLDSAALLERARERIAASPSLRDRVYPVDFTCFGRCGEGPNVMVLPLADGADPEDEPDLDAMDGALGLYIGMNDARLDRVLDAHCETGEPIAEWAERY